MKTFRTPTILHTVAPIGAVAVCGAWAFGPVLRRMLSVWQSEPDYEHGFLVPLVACAMLWVRRARRPAAVSDWRALPVIVAALAMWIAGGRFYVAALQDLGFLLWLVGACWLLAGSAVVRWAAPALGFLAFMIPVPYRVEQLVTLPMQHTTTAWSCWLLQCCGLTALADGNVLLLGDLRLEVAEACSGLRLFMCVVALSYLYAAFAPAPRWMKLVLFLSVAPVAMAANTLRLTATAVAWKHVDSPVGRELIHDAAGWLMIPTAAALLALVLWYLFRITVPVETVEPTRLLRRGYGPATINHAAG